MDSLKQILQKQVENRPYDSTHHPGYITLIIWDGPCIDNMGKIFQSLGYYKDSHTVFCCEKVKYDMLMQDRYTFTPAELKATEELIYGKSAYSYINEVIKRKGVSHGTTVADTIKKENLDITDAEFDANKNKLIKLITFYLKEVIRCNVDAVHGLGLDKLSTGGKPLKHLAYVKARINGMGQIDADGVQFVASPYFPPIAHRAVPQGGGEQLSKYASKSVTVSFLNKGNNIQARIGRNYNRYNDLYRIQCLFNEPQIAFDGDIWFEGVRSSITNGIHEVWVDNLGGGPMLSASRRFVRHAAAKYHWDIDPTEITYGNSRVNPLSDMTHSNCITPVQTYITDWFGDPNLYAGILNVVIALLSGINGDDNIVKYSKEVIDLGVFDYEKLYRRLEGGVI